MAALETYTGVSAESLAAVRVRWTGRERKSRRLQAEAALERMREAESRDDAIAAAWAAIDYVGQVRLSAVVLSPIGTQELRDASEACHRLIRRQR
jgi:hypothetical protein